MTRLRNLNPLDWCDLEKRATTKGYRLQYRRSRCQHGYTRDQSCRSCEQGYVDDTSSYAKLPNVLQDDQGQYLIAESDDMEDVAFVRAR